MQRAARTGLLPLVSGITLVTAIVWIYGAVAGAELTNWDDDRFLTYNPLFHSDGLTYLYAALTRVQFEAYQPLHLISYLPDHYLWPDWPSGFHLVNVALFVADIVLLWQLVRRHASGHAAFAAAALFALHPVCVEPVAWVTARKDLVMMLFFVLALRCEDEHHGPRPSLRALVFTLCALLSKSASACLPIVVFAWLRWVQRRPLREALVRSAGHAVLALAVSVFVYAVWRDHAMIASVPLAQRPLEVAATLATYTAHVAWPVDLAAVYPDRIAHPIAALIACAVAAAALAAGWRWLPARARFAAVAACGALLPVSNLVPMSQRFADRYLFAVLAVLALPIAAALDWIVARARPRLPRAGLWVALAVLVVAGVEATASARLAPSWQSSRTLWAHAVTAQPTAFLARLKYAETLEDAQQWRAAMEQLRAASLLRPRSLHPRQRLFEVAARIAELRGAVPPGTAARWSDASDHAMTDRAAYLALVPEVDRTQCQACGDALALLGVAAWPESDAELLDEARRALDRQLAARARIYLGQVRDRTSSELAQLQRRASAPASPAAP